VRVARPPEPGALANALAIGISWLAACGLVIGIAWVASAASANPPPGTPPSTLPLALAWSGASLAGVLSSVGSLFARGRQRSLLLATSAALTAVLVAATLAGRAAA
jgi:hypothetical protein